LFKAIGSFNSRRIIYRVVKGAPSFGALAFGVIDRGTNVLQARPTTICPLNCVFCSVDAGPMSEGRWAEFIASLEVIVDGVKYAGVHKGGGLEVLIDTVGDPLTYPQLIELVKMVKEIRTVRSVAIETHGALLSKQLVNKLWEAGLDRVNLSIDTLSEEKARKLYGAPWFSLRKVIEAAEYLVKETSIDLHVTPLWIPGVNDEDIREVVKWALRIGAGKKWPPVTIQKYIAHKYGRKVPGVKPMSWGKFWRSISELEKELGTKLSWNMGEWGMEYRKRIPTPLMKGDLVTAEIVGRGLFHGEYIGLIDYKGWRAFITLLNYKGGPTRVLARVIRDEDGIYIGKVFKYIKNDHI